MFYTDIYLLSSLLFLRQFSHRRLFKRSTTTLSNGNDPKKWSLFALFDDPETAFANKIKIALEEVLYIIYWMQLGQQCNFILDLFLHLLLNYK